MDRQVWEIYVPTMRKDGRPIRTRFHRVWDQKVMKITDGLSVHSPSLGRWLNSGGQVFRDRMIPVRIVATHDQMEKIIDMTLKYYEDEEAILCYRISNDVILRYRDDETSDRG